MRLQDDPYLRQGADPALLRQLDNLWRQLAAQVNGLTEGRIAAVHSAMAAAPTAGEYVQGDMVRNIAPSGATPVLGWVCVASGNPGTWVAITLGGGDGGFAAWLASLKDLPNAPDDAAAAALGVPEGGMYRNGSALMVRVSGSDPFIAHVVSIGNDFGADGSTSFPDVLSHTWTAVGDAVVDLDNSNFPDGAIIFDGSGDYVDGDSSSDWTFGPGAWCVETFIQLTGSGNRAICSFLSNNTWYINGSGDIYFYDGASNILNGGGFPTGSAVHVALSRDASGNFRMFVGGVLVASGTWSGNVSSSNFRWGAATGGSPSSFFSGWRGRHRITKGVPRYTTSFTPPSGPFPVS